jgi:intracellular sulfur oxidation DsrE/DsrF family protein
MKSMSRRSFVSNAAMGVTALSALSAGSGCPRAEAQLVYTTTEWKLADFHQLVNHPARVKQVYDAVAIDEGKFLNNMKNSLNGLHFGFGVPAEEIQLVGALHGPANMLNYDDFIWKKYQIGAWLKVTDPATGQPAVKNPLYSSKAGPDLHYTSQDPNSRDSIYQDKSIQALQHRGVKFLSCHTATEEQARALIQHSNLAQQPEEIVKEMLAHLLPQVLVVASMVAAIALLQTDGKYSYIKV